MVLLVFIAEYPQRRFFFNIPGWVIGVVIIAHLGAQLPRQRQWLLLLNFLLGLVADRARGPVDGTAGRS